MTGAAEAGRDFERFLQQNLRKELLRFTTAGSVDDGKSTLIGRLLHDSKAVYEDQLAAVKRSRINRSGGAIDFSLITDGLQAEREQGITIDVGYRYFATAKRKFIIADTPGHEQYTRNMATGASTADMAVILIDAGQGIQPQTLRHAYIASLLGIPRVLGAINKIDLLQYRPEPFTALEADFTRLARQLGFAQIQCIPVSALHGDNVAERGPRMPWFHGPTLLEHLEQVPLSGPAAARAARFSVQYVIRPNAGFRGFAGQVASGVIRPGDRLLALPSGEPAQVEAIVTMDGLLPEAFAPMSVTLKLANQIDLSRGDMLVAADDPPSVSRRFSAMVVWMHPDPLKPGRSYLIKLAARQVRGRALEIRHRVNLTTLEPEPAACLGVNDIGAVEFETVSPLFFDAYRKNRSTGSFIVIDPRTNATLAAGMIEAARSPQQAESRPSPDPDGPVAAAERHLRHGHRPAIILTGAWPGQVAALERALFQRGFEVFALGASSSPPAPAAAAALHAAGYVVLYDHPGLGAEEARELRSLAGSEFLDLDTAVPASPIGQVVAFAELLRLRQKDEQKAE